MTAPAGLRRELARKLWHVLILVYLGLYLSIGQASFLRWMLAWSVFVFAAETVRLRVEAAQRLLMRFFGPIVREREVRSYSGMVFTNLGLLVTAALYGREPRLVTAAVLSLALGDAAAALVGMSLGRLKFSVRGQTRTVEGAAAGFVVATLCGAGAGLGWAPALAGGAAVTLVDCVPPPPDDNFWIPLASAVAAGAVLGVAPARPW